MNSKMLTTLAALALATSLAGSGCMAPSSSTEEITDGQDEVVSAATNQATEKTGEADQACGGFGWGGGWFGGCGGFGWGGFGWGGGWFGGWSGCGCGGWW